MSDINDCIAKAKGWTLYIATGEWAGPSRIWADPDGFPGMHPDFTGTLEGVAGMMREMGQAWGLHFIEDIDKWCYYDHVGPGGLFYSDVDRPGDCVGEAWLSVLGKEAGDVTAK
ncbi:unnamed protein product [marine sediment metagenome]|uniref:Uncharacterized protein n=1 Tax=marine sediment metagenome TaxID=412755 RepID=X0VSB6_9ZZZZ